MKEAPRGKGKGYIALSVYKGSSAGAKRSSIHRPGPGASRKRALMSVCSQGRPQRWPQRWRGASLTIVGIEHSRELAKGKLLLGLGIERLKHISVRSTWLVGRQI
eukprot:1158554-Pelagomonas_calceolata.AAC.8